MFNKIKNLYPDIKNSEFELRDDSNGEGVYISKWTYLHASKPTLEQLQSVPSETPEQAAKRLEAALDTHLDSVAQSYRYESIRTMVTYATSEHLTFGAEGRAAVKWRDACYDKAYKIQADVIAGLRQIPSESELILEMPLFSEFLNYE